MSYASWAHVSPTSGSGNGSTSWTADANTGRKQRNTSALYSAGSISRIANIVLAGAPLFITITTPAGTQNQQGGGTSSYSASNAGASLNILGTTNAASIAYDLQSITGVDGSLSLNLPANYTANSNSTANGADITGDPGSSAQFSFSIPVTIPANTTTGTLGCMIRIEGMDDSYNTVEWDITIISAAGDAYLYIGTSGNTSPVTVNLNNTGTAQTVSVFSNTSWTIS